MHYENKDKIPFLAIGGFDYSILIIKDRVVGFHECSGAGAYYKDDYRKVIFNIVKRIIGTNSKRNPNYISLYKVANAFCKMHLEIIQEDIDSVNYKITDRVQQKKPVDNNLLNKKSKLEMKLKKDKVNYSDSIVSIHGYDKFFDGCPTLKFEIIINSNTQILSLEDIIVTNILGHYDESQEIIIEHHPILLSLNEALIIFTNLYLYHILSDLQYDYNNIEGEKSDSVGERELIYIMSIEDSIGNLQVNRHLKDNLPHKSTNLMIDYILQYSRYIRNLLNYNLIKPQRLLELGTFNLLSFLQDSKIVQEFFVEIVNFLEEMNPNNNLEFHKTVLYTLLLKECPNISFIKQISSSCKMKLNSFIDKHFIHSGMIKRPFFNIN